MTKNEQAGVVFELPTRQNNIQQTAHCTDTLRFKFYDQLLPSITHPPPVATVKRESATVVMCL